MVCLLPLSFYLYPLGHQRETEKDRILGKASENISPEEEPSYQPYKDYQHTQTRRFYSRRELCENSHATQSKFTPYSITIIANSVQAPR